MPTIGVENSEYFFGYKNIQMYTLNQHTRSSKSIIDYFITKQQSKLRVQPVKVNRGAECRSVCLVMGKIYPPFVDRNHRGINKEHREK